MFIVVKTDSNGNKYPSFPTLHQEDAQLEFDRPIYGRFVTVDLLSGDPVVGFETLSTKSIDAAV